MTMRDELREVLNKYKFHPTEEISEEELSAIIALFTGRVTENTITNIMVDCANKVFAWQDEDNRFITKRIKKELGG